MKKIILTSLLFSLATLVNATPSTITLTANSIDENSAAVTIVGTASGNGTGTHSYTVENTFIFAFDVVSQEGAVGYGANGANTFRIQRPNNAGILTIAAINFNDDDDNNNPAATLVTAINDLTASTGVSASIGATNAATEGEVILVVPISLSGATLIGFNAFGNVAGSTVALSTIAFKSISNAVITSTISNLFSIDATTGVLESNVAFNYEERASYTIVIKATDSGGSYSKNFYIYINDVGDTPTDITSNTTTLSIQENNSIGDIIATFSTVDDNGGNHTYTLTGATDNNFFSIDNNGVLTANVAFDFETQSTYTVTINTNDGTPFHATYSKDFTIIIIDGNDGLMLSSRSVAENNAIGTTVGILATDGGTRPYSYNIDIRKNFTFTVEEVDNGNPALNTFKVVELGGATTTFVNTFYTYGTASASIANFVVTIINGDTESTSFAAIEVDDATVRLTGWDDKYDGGRFIGASSTDVDGNLVDYIKTTYDDATLPIPGYNYFSIDGDKLITTAVFDQATLGSYTITISSTDANNIVVSEDFIITVAEGPSGAVTEITISKNTITNQAADGATVGFLSTNATDTGRAYALVDNTATFSISGDKLTANNPNTLQTGTISVSISTLNGDNTIFTQSLTITVTNDPAFSLDVDGNGSFTASNDGLIIFKYLLNSNANNLHTTIANDAVEGRKTTIKLKKYLDNAKSLLDIDGNGSLTASNDGLIIFKYLLNSNANNLHTTIANNALDDRKTTPELKAYLDLYSE